MAPDEFEYCTCPGPPIAYKLEAKFSFLDVPTTMSNQIPIERTVYSSIPTNLIIPFPSEVVTVGPETQTSGWPWSSHLVLEQHTIPIQDYQDNERGEDL